MRRVKRTAISLMPKQPYVAWANALEVGGVKIGTDFMPEETIYLIEDTADAAPWIWNLAELNHSVFRPSSPPVGMAVDRSLMVRMVRSVCPSAESRIEPARMSSCGKVPCAASVWPSTV